MPKFDPKLPTACLLGRYQPPHEGHLWLVEEAVRRVGQVVILVREPILDDRNPFTFEEILKRWAAIIDDAGLRERVRIERVPNITNVFYGRDVGYRIEELNAPPRIQAISATKIREAARG